LRYLKVSTWAQTAALLSLDPYSYTHLVTSLQNFQQTRWEGTIAFAGLAIEEQLAARYARDAPNVYPLWTNENATPQDLKNMNLDKLVRWARLVGIFNDDLAAKAHQIRQARNFFSHAYAIMREKIRAAIADGSISDLVPASLGVPDYLAPLFASASIGGVAPGVLNSEEAASLVVSTAMEVLRAST